MRKNIKEDTGLGNRKCLQENDTECKETVLPGHLLGSGPGQCSHHSHLNSYPHSSVTKSLSHWTNRCFVFRWPWRFLNLVNTMKKWNVSQEFAYWPGLCWAKSICWTSLNRPLPAWTSQPRFKQRATLSVTGLSPRDVELPLLQEITHSRLHTSNMWLAASASIRTLQKTQWHQQYWA